MVASIPVTPDILAQQMGLAPKQQKPEGQASQALTPPPNNTPLPGDQFMASKPDPGAVALPWETPGPQTLLPPMPSPLAMPVGANLGQPFPPMPGFLGSQPQEGMQPAMAPAFSGALSKKPLNLQA